ncbi:MAG: glycosyltransferase family 4 protein [Acidobacteria bacterium]|nr:glycosyltransferase family 4 protein [Acidobacteriota bacterium]
MYILHLDTGDALRGGQQQVLLLMEGLRERGHQQLLAAPGGSPLAEAARQHNLALHPLKSAGRSFANLRAIRQLAKDFEIVHAHDSHAHSLAWLARAACGNHVWPHLIVSRRVAFPINKFGRIKYAAADAYIAVSEYGRQQLIQANVPAGKVHVIYDGVQMPPPCDAAARIAFRDRLGVSADASVIGTFTALAPEKRLQEQLDLLAVVPRSVHLWIGHPATAPARDDTQTVLTDYAKYRQVQDRFRIVPLADDLSVFLDSLDVFLYLSRAEGLGSAILLAMAHRLPVVASRVGGIPEIVRHNETGLLVGDLPAGQAFTTELCSTVSLLLQNEAMRRAFGSAGREFVLANATVEIMVHKTEAVYEHLLHARRSAQVNGGIGAAGATR